MNARDRLVDGIGVIHREADGVLVVDVVRRQDCPELLLAALGGDLHSMNLLWSVYLSLDNIAKAPRNRPMLCGSCPRPLNGDADFAIVIAAPENADRTKALGMAICTGCAATVPAITAKAAEALRKIWPDLRHVEVSAAVGHA